MKKFQKIVLVLILGLSLVLVTGCTKKERLYVMNWAQYMSKDVMKAFEKEYNVKIIEDIAESNELMYTRISTNAQPYDIMIPSDYMIDRLEQEGLLQKIDFTKLENYSHDKFAPKVNELLADTGLGQYAVPYFWGSLGIMYNKDKAGVKEAVEGHAWKVFFEKDLLPAGTKVGMYYSSRDVIACAQMYLNIDFNSKADADLEAAKNLLMQQNYDMWGTDDLKEAVAAKNLDIALVYSGDFFDTVYNYMYNDMEITFDMYAPTEINNVWFDAMVIPTTSKNPDLAHKFIDYFLEHENALENAFEVGYCPSLQGVYEEMLADEEIAIVVTHPAYLPDEVNGVSYHYLGADVSTKMDNILNEVRK